MINGLWGPIQEYWEMGGFVIVPLVLVCMMLWYALTYRVLSIRSSGLTPRDLIEKARQKKLSPQTPLEEVAEKFNMTPRTLQRKLKQEGTSFLRLRDSCRHNRALRELGNPHIEIDSLAELLGFSDTTNFYHAFKRWQGEAPGEYRKRVLAAASESDGQ